MNKILPSCCRYFKVFHQFVEEKNSCRFFKVWRDILNFSVDTLQRSHHLSGDFHLIRVIQVIQVIQPICTFPTIEIKAFVEKGKNCSPFFTRKAFYEIIIVGMKKILQYSMFFVNINIVGVDHISNLVRMLFMVLLMLMLIVDVCILFYSFF